MKQPTPEQIKEARHSAGLSQTKAGELVHKTLRAWQHWESGTREMDLAVWELFLIKVKKV